MMMTLQSLHCLAISCRCQSTALCTLNDTDHTHAGHSVDPCIRDQKRFIISDFFDYFQALCVKQRKTNENKTHDRHWKHKVSMDILRR